MTATKARGTGAADMQDILKRFEDAYGKALKDLGRFNLVAFGDAGVGKSTLVNSIFGGHVAQTGAGRPVTQATTYHEHPNGVLGFYDTKGIETGHSKAEVVSDLRKIIDDQRSKPVSEQIHVIWYCLRSTDRWEPADAAIVRELASEGVPIVVVMTQVRKRPDGQVDPTATTVAEAIVDDELPISPENRVFMTMAVADEFGGWETHGLEDLLDATFRLAPESVRGALIAAESIDLRRKASEARKYIAGAATAAAAAGATPIPFADAAVLVPIQVGLMAKISAVFGLAIDKGTLATLAGAAFSAGGVTQLGKYIVTNMLKFLPGGNIAGGVIRAGVASSLTVAVGEAWIAVSTQLVKLGAERASSMSSDEIRTLFLDEFKTRAAKTTIRGRSGALNTREV
jgi:uncharacterized protein (DUF697 family)/GTPase SAR1 family protein